MALFLKALGTTDREGGRSKKWYVPLQPEENEGMLAVRINWGFFVTKICAAEIPSLLQIHNRNRIQHPPQMLVTLKFPGLNALLH